MNDTASMSFDYEAALAACARGDRSALRRIYEQEAGRLASTGHAAAAGRTAGHVNRLARYIDRRRIEEGIA